MSRLVSRLGYNKGIWLGSRALVPLDDIICSWCHDTFDVTYVQPALFVHGGYGATEGRKVRTCRCGAIFSVSSFTLNPRKELT